MSIVACTHTRIQTDSEKESRDPFFCLFHNSRLNKGSIGYKQKSILFGFRFASVSFVFKHRPNFGWAR